MNAGPAIDAHFASVRADIPAFCARYFGLGGSALLHSRSFASDIFLSPINLFLVGPRLALHLTGLVLARIGLRRAGKLLVALDISVPTTLRRRIRDVLAAELLQLDSLEQSIPEEERLRWRARIGRLVGDYLEARDAVAEFAAGLAALTFGFLVLDRLTPGAISLGPILASGYAHDEAVNSFWLGPWAGEAWYGLVGVDTPIAWIVLGIALMIVVLSLIATIIGVVVDPIQTWTGIHKRRLHRLVDGVERATRDAADVRLSLKDPYLPRLADLFDLAVSALRFGR